MEIKQLREITDEVVLALKKLMVQLDKGIEPSFERLNKIVHSEEVFLFVAEEDGVIIGTTTLVTYLIPSGMKAWIEDVVVDESARGKGLGRKLVQHAVDKAKVLGAAKIDLTSQYKRVAARKLYESMGFVIRENNVFRLRFD